MQVLGKILLYPIIAALVFTNAVFYVQNENIVPDLSSDTLVGSSFTTASLFKLSSSSITTINNRDFYLGSGTSSASGDFAVDPGNGTIYFNDFQNCNLDTVDGFLSCGTDATGGGGGTLIEIQDDGTDKGSFSSISFDGNAFTVTDTSGEATVKLDWTNGPASKALSNTWSALQIFSVGASGSNSEWTGYASASQFFGPLTGNVTGNADTATALASDPTNCSAGSYPLGIDENGNVESCTDATTEIDSAISTHAAIADAHQDLVTLGTNTATALSLSGQELSIGDVFIQLGGDSVSGNFSWSGNHLFSGAVSSSYGEFTGYASASQLFGASLATCGDSTHALSWTGGLFGCQTITTSGDGTNSNIPFVTIGNTASLSLERALVGQTHKIVITDEGANGEVSVSFPYTATLANNPALGASQCTFASTGIICEGSTADTSESILTFTDPTADRTITFPNASFTVPNPTTAVTLTGNWVNTTNPWADNEVADTITVSGGTLGSNTISSGATWTTAGTLTIGDNGDAILISATNWDVNSAGLINVTNASVSNGFEASGYASASLLYGAGLSTCESGSFLTWSGGLFGCDVDANDGGSGISSIEIGHIDGGDVAHVTSLSFADSHFNITNTASEGYVRLDWTNGPASRSIAQTIAGLWTFTGGVTVSSNFEVTGKASLSQGFTIDPSGDTGASVSIPFEFTDYASASRYFGAGLTSCTGSNKLLWSAGVFSCGTDQTGSSGTAIEIQDGSSDIGSFTSVSFEGNSFVVTDTSGEATVKLDWTNGPASRATANTWSALNIFSAGASGSNSEWTGYASASAYFGTAFGGIDCNDAGDQLLWSGGVFTCETLADADIPNDITIDLAATASDLSCTDCINATEIEDIYVLLAGDSSSGNYSWSGNHLFSGAVSSSYGEFTGYASASALFVGGNPQSGTNSGDVTLAGTPNYLTLSNQQITLTKLDISDDTNMTAGTDLTLTANDLTLDSTLTQNFTFNATGTAFVVSNNASVSGSFETTTASASSYFGSAFAGLGGTDGCSGADDTLNYTASTGKFSCGSDSAGSGGGTQIEVQDGTSDIGSFSSISFEASKFVVTDTTGEAFINLASNALDFDEIINTPVLDANLAFTASAGFNVDWQDIDLLDIGFLRADRLGVNKDVSGAAAIDALTSSTLQGLRVENSADSNITFSSYVTGDSFVRFTFLGDGDMEWGSGAVAADTNLYRGGANLLSTDDSFSVGANASISGNLETIGFASASQVFGAGLATCQSGSFLTWNAGLFGCDTDDTGSGGSAIEVQDGTSDIGSFSSISFQANSFVVTDTTGEAFIQLDWTNGPASKAAANTWSALQIFSLGASFSQAGEFATYASASSYLGTAFNNIDCNDATDKLLWSAGLFTCGTLADADIPDDITINLATLATTLTITDNESTDETNAILFTSGGDLDGGNLGIESDGDLTYNPSSGLFSVTGISAATATLTGQFSGVSASLSANLEAVGYASASFFTGSAFSSVGDCNDAGEILLWSGGVFSCGSDLGGTSGNNNELLTDDGSGGITSEGNLTFDGSLFNVSGSASVSANFEVVGYASSSLFFGSSLTACTSSGNVLRWSSGAFSCGTLADADIPNDLTLGTVSGTVDAGGATAFEIPNGTNPTFSALGQVYYDSSLEFFKIATQSAGPGAVIPAREIFWKGTIASTSVDFVSGGRIPLSPVPPSWKYIITGIECSVDTATSVVINIANMDGSNNTESVTCDVDGQSDTSIDTNADYTGYTKASSSLEFGTVSGSPDYLTFIVYGYWRE